MNKSTQKFYPVVKCESVEFESNRQMGIVRTSADSALQTLIDAAMHKHVLLICGLNEQGDKFWRNMRAKYSLDENKNYGIRIIDGKPFICEIKETMPE